jgi:uncharacterized membrane protein
MTILIIGLLLFLGIHSVRIFADDARSRFIAKQGAGAWKGLYSLLSALGLAAIIYGYSVARTQPVVLWAPLPGMRHLAALLVLVAIVLMVATYVPGNAFKATLHHPMVLSIKVWALAHLLANTTLASTVLFGSFLVWAALSFRAARQRDRAAGTVYAPGRTGPTMVTLLVGVGAWAAFGLWVHGAWLGLRPFASMMG